MAALLLLTLLPSSAHASFWLRCDVWADVSKAEQSKQYKVMVLRAEVVEGHMEAGSPCMGSYIGHSLTVHIPDENVPLGEGKKLRYEYYNGRGEHGPITNETWSVPGLFKYNVFGPK